MNRLFTIGLLLAAALVPGGFARAADLQPYTVNIGATGAADLDATLQGSAQLVTLKDKVAIPHHHDVEFQMVYVLKGWFSSQFEGHGTHTFRAGSSWMQPPKIKHTVVGYSDDCELLEIVLPADFETVTFDQKSKPAAKARPSRR